MRKLALTLCPGSSVRRRAVAQRCPSPPMKNLISVGGQHQGDTIMITLAHFPVSRVDSKMNHVLESYSKLIVHFLVWGTFTWVFYINVNYSKF